MQPDKAIELFSTCPPLSGVHEGSYLRRAVDVARWSDAAGCRGILVYADNSQVDPWLLSQIIVQNTKALCPLVAVQPIYTHPYTVAKLVTSLAYLHGRRTYLNMVAGGFKNDLIALNDTTPHDRRYDRVVEYTAIVSRLLAGAVVSYKGEFYNVDKLKLTPPLSPNLLPGIFVSGSSEAGLAAARALGATAVKYPEPADKEQEAELDQTVSAGIRVGIVTREDAAHAWTIARARFPEDRRGQVTHQLAMKVSDSVWHKQLSELGNGGEQGPYWLVPFQNYKTMCPYLVGSYERVGEELARYIAVGYCTFILDVPVDPDDLHHTSLAFQHALEVSKCHSSSTSG